VRDDDGSQEPVAITLKRTDDEIIDRNDRK
jgi:hypothetical protein